MLSTQNKTSTLTDKRVNKILSIISDASVDTEDIFLRWHFDAIIKTLLGDQSTYEKWVLDWEAEHNQKWDTWALTYHIT